MKLGNYLLLCLLLAPAALPQSAKPALEHKGEFAFGEGFGNVIAHRFVEGEDRLVLVGPKVVRVIDVATATISEPRLIEVPDFNEDRHRLVSPDGRRLIIFGNYDSGRKEDRVKRPPTVWDLQTGRQIAALDKTGKPVRAALWSRNGKTLATSSDKYAPRFTDSDSVEVAFWDGETFEYKNSLPSDKIGWWRLTDDGGACVYSTGEVKGRIPLIDTKYVSPSGPVSLWNVAAGKVEQIASTRGGGERKVRAINLSPDGKFLALLVQPPKSKDAERRIAVWEIVADDAPRHELRLRYEISPSPKIDRNGAFFSPGGKYFALGAGRNLQIYETRTGEKRFELQDFDSPSAWLNDEIVYDHYSRRMEVFDAATGKELYRHRLIYDASEHTPHDPNSTTPGLPVTQVNDETKIVAHPRGALFLTHSNQYVKVFDARTGRLLQTLVSPPTDYSGKQPKLSDKRLVSHAEWSGDGKTLLVFDADKRSVSLWRLTEN